MGCNAPGNMDSVKVLHRGAKYKEIKKKNVLEYHFNHDSQRQQTG